ncbi:lipopolysaccharide assembly protein b [Anaeramoeba flamelloides]|uniref:Lipopolysaccharide assembly protein b n=1 Tax=Anaeramoeba flamelloides TaxID=1746091 RepID=A0ABQ8Z3I0_9EUKA|nr:lipopolysaccharide assembly protein b [Anaeramoeba flamelloides]
MSKHFNFPILSSVRSPPQNLFNIALQGFHNTIEQNSGLRLQSFGLVRMLIKSGKNDQAYSTLLRASEQSNNEPFSLRTCGVLFFELGKNEEALDHFKRVLKLLPGDIKTLIFLGKIYRSEGMILKAVKTLRKAHTLDPKNEKLLIELSVVLKEFSESKESKELESTQEDLVDEACEYLNNIVSNQSKHLKRALLLLGQFRLKYDPQVSIEYFQKLIELDPESIPAYFGIVSAIINHGGKSNTAIISLEKILSISPNNLEAHKHLITLLHNIEKEKDKDTDNYDNLISVEYSNFKKFVIPNDQRLMNSLHSIYRLEPNNIKNVFLLIKYLEKDYYILKKKEFDNKLNKKIRNQKQFLHENEMEIQQERERLEEEKEKEDDQKDHEDNDKYKEEDNYEQEKEREHEILTKLFELYRYLESNLENVKPGIIWKIANLNYKLNFEKQSKNYFLTNQKEFEEDIDEELINNIQNYYQKFLLIKSNESISKLEEEKEEEEEEEKKEEEEEKEIEIEKQDDKEEEINEKKSLIIAHIHLGKLYLYQKIYDKAFSEFNLANTIDDNDLVITLNLANFYRRIGSLEMSISFYKKILLFESRNIECLYWLGWVYGQMNDYEKCFEYYIKVVELSPRHSASLYYTLGYLFDVYKKDFELAKKYYNISLSLKENYFPSMFNLASLLSKNKETYASAISYFEKMLLIQPKNLQVKHNLALLLLKKEETLERGIEAWEEITKMVPNSADAYFNLALAYKKHGQKKHAIKNYNRALEIEPKMAKALNNLAVIYANDDFRQKAYMHWSRALKLKPKCIKYLKNFGKWLFAIEKYEHSKIIFEEILNLELDSKWDLLCKNCLQVINTKIYLKYNNFATPKKIRSNTRRKSYNKSPTYIETSAKSTYHLNSKTVKELTSFGNKALSIKPKNIKINYLTKNANMNKKNNNTKNISFLTKQNFKHLFIWNEDPYLLIDNGPLKGITIGKILPHGVIQQDFEICNLAPWCLLQNFNSIISIQIFENFLYIFIQKHSFDKEEKAFIMKKFQIYRLDLEKKKWDQQWNKKSLNYSPILNASKFNITNVILDTTCIKNYYNGSDSDSNSDSDSDSNTKSTRITKKKTEIDPYFYCLERYGRHFSINLFEKTCKDFKLKTSAGLEVLKNCATMINDEIYLFHTKKGLISFDKRGNIKKIRMSSSSKKPFFSKEMAKRCSLHSFNDYLFFVQPPKAIWRFDTKNLEWVFFPAIEFQLNSRIVLNSSSLYFIDKQGNLDSYLLTQIDPQKTQISDSNFEKVRVGHPAYVTISAYDQNGRHLKGEGIVNVKAVVIDPNNQEIEPQKIQIKDKRKNEKLKINFTSTLAGKYQMKILVNEIEIPQSPLRINYYPDVIKPEMFSFNSNVVDLDESNEEIKYITPQKNENVISMPQNKKKEISLIAKDKFNNLIHSEKIPLEDLHIIIYGAEKNTRKQVFIPKIFKNENDGSFIFDLQLSMIGKYKLLMEYQNRSISWNPLIVDCIENLINTSDVEYDHQNVNIKQLQSNGENENFNENESESEKSIREVENDVDGQSEEESESSNASTDLSLSSEN